MNTRIVVGFASPLAAVMGLSGCAVGPDYEAPTGAAPADFSSLQDPAQGAAPTVPTATALVAGEADFAVWWRVFNDPIMDRLIERAVQSNVDLRAATARVREARALRGLESSGLYPEVSANGAATRSRASDNLGPGSFAPSGETSFFDVGLDATWEIDVFGGVRRAVQAADADLAMAVEDRRDILVTVVAEVARNYTELRGLQRRVSLAEHTIHAQQETLDLTNARFRAGLSADLEVAQSQAQLATRQSQLPLLRAALRQAAHRLDVLLGQQPGTVLTELTAEGVIPAPPSRVPVGLPSDLLRRRPDVRRAERGIAGATARVGVATSDLFPKVSLTGSFGFQSAQTGELFDYSSRAWSFGPTVRWNIFNAGRVRSSIAAANAREEQALAAYDQTVLLSFEEVENALTGFIQEQERREALQAAVDANRRAVALSTDRYRSGVGDFLNVLESQREAYFSEDQLVQSEADVTRSLIALYKALGGGWGAPTESAASGKPVAVPAPAVANES